MENKKRKGNGEIKPMIHMRQNGKYIYQKDYNIYIMPNGNVTETFLQNKEVK